MGKHQGGFKASWNRSFNSNFEAMGIVSAFLKGVKLPFCNFSNVYSLVAILFIA